MAGKPGYKISLKIGRASDNTLVDVTNYTTQVALNRAKEQIEASVLGQANKEYVSGQHSWVVPFSGLWDPVADEVFNDNMAEGTDMRNCEIGWEGTGSGKVKYTGKINLSQFDTSGGNASNNTFTCSGQGTGAIARGVF